MKDILSKEEKKILKDIESGKYRDFYLEYGRKSTDDTDNQKNSIKYQRSENTRFAFKNKLPIAPITIEGFCRDGIISERHSAFKENEKLNFIDGHTIQYRIERPKFYRLAEWLNKKYFKGVIFLCWDRAARNKGDEIIIRRLMKAGSDIRFTLATYDKSSSGELHMDIDGMFSEHHSRVTREKVSLTIYNSRKDGLCTNKAPVGYLNLGEMDHKPFDPMRAPLIRKFFEMYATGEWSLADLARWAIDQGFTMPPVRRRRTQEEVLAEEEDDVRIDIEKISRLPSYNTIHKILTNPAYMGKTLNHERAWIDSTAYEAIVSEDLFFKVQEQLRKQNKSAHYADFLDYPLRGIVHCACGRAYSPYVKKGITYYRCRCKADCVNSNKNFNFEFIFTKVGSLIEKLSFTKEEIEKIDARASTDIALLETKRHNQLENAERRKKKIREDLAYLNANRLSLLRSGAYTPESLVEEETKLNIELTALKDDENTSDESMTQTIKDVVKLSELLKDAHNTYSFAEPMEKEKFIRVIFTELTISENTLDYQCKNGFKALSSRFVASCDATGI